MPHQFEAKKIPVPVPMPSNEDAEEGHDEGKDPPPPLPAEAQATADGSAAPGSPAPPPMPPRKRRPPPKEESPGRRAGALLDINMLVLALFFITDLPVGRNSVRQRIQQASISRDRQKNSIHHSTYWYIPVCTAQNNPVQHQYIPVCTSMYLFVLFNADLVPPCTSLYRFCSTLYRLVPPCTVLYRLVLRWYKVVQDSTYWYIHLESCTPVQDGMYRYVPACTYLDTNFGFLVHTSMY